MRRKRCCDWNKAQLYPVFDVVGMRVAQKIGNDV